VTTTAIKERPILFSGPMVRAILDGSKTQTRRVVDRVARRGRVTEFNPSDTPGYDWTFRDSEMRWHDLRAADLLARCPFGQPGDRLWVRESHAFQSVASTAHDEYVVYQADGEIRPHDWSMELDRDFVGEPLDLDSDFVHDNALGEAFVQRWRPSIHMHRWASRVTLEITEVRVERVQSISEADAKAEGVQGVPTLSSEHPLGLVGRFRELWDSINAARGHGWGANPWVWVVAFRRVDA